MISSNKITPLAILLSASVWISACSQDFEPFNLLDKLRVLAIAADPPELQPGASADLTALVYEPDGEPVSYRWSWCPLATGPASGFECAVDEAELRAMMDEVIPGGGALLPPFEMGAEPSTRFSYAVSAVLLRSLCESLLSKTAPSFVELPDCSDEIKISIRLDVAAGSEKVTAVKALGLKLNEGAQINRNPDIGPIAAVSADLGASVALDEETPAVLSAGADYLIQATVPAEAPEIFTPKPMDGQAAPEPRREGLFMTWFITSGSTDFERTTFLDGEVSLAELARNTWSTEEPTSTGSEFAGLYLVLQDERGGVGWAMRNVEIKGN